MSATIKQIYDRLLDGQTVTVKLADKRAGDNLRVALAKIHREFVAADFTNDSLLFSWDSSACRGSYKLGYSTRRAVSTFEIIEDETQRTSQSEQVSETLGDDQSLRGSSDSEVSEVFAGAIDPSDAEVQEQDQRA